jgi:hypothetical protein
LRVIGVTGHQQLPGIAREYVENEFERIISETNSSEETWGVTSLAIGADQLFARTVLFAGGKLEVVIPCAGYESTFAAPDDLRSFKSLLARATKVDHLNFNEPSEDAFFEAGCRVVDVCQELVAVWDGAEARGLGGTAHIVKYARKLGRPVTVVWPEGVQR